MAHFSNDLPRYIAVVTRALDAQKMGMHPYDIAAAHRSRRSVENLVAGAKADGSYRSEMHTGTWDGLTVAQIVTGVVAEEAQAMAHMREAA